MKVRPKLEPVEEIGKVATVGGYDVVAYVFEGKDVMFGLRRGGRFVLGVYNDVGRMLMFTAYAGQGSEVLMAKTKVGGVEAEVYSFKLDAGRINGLLER